MYHDGEKIVHMPAIKTEVVDTTGAGDTLNGNLCAFLAKGMNLHDALEKAMYASAMKLTQKSAQAGMPYRDQLEEYIKKQTEENIMCSEKSDISKKDKEDNIEYE